MTRQNMAGRMVQGRGGVGAMGVSCARLILAGLLAWAWSVDARAQTAGTALWNYPTLAKIVTTPAIGPDGGTYFGSTDTRFYALRANGTLRWRYATGGEIWSSASLDAAGRVYFGSDDGQCYALNSDGTAAWIYAVGNKIQSTPTLGPDGTVYFGSHDGKFYALTRTGTLRWTYAAGGAILGSAALHPDGTLYFGAYDGKLHALAPDGTLKWTFATAHTVHSSPAFGLEGVIYFGSRDGKVYAVSPEGLKLWEFATRDEIYSSPVIGPDGAIYIGSNDRSLYALNPDGTRRWEFKAPDWISTSPVVGQGGTIYFGCRDYKLYALNPTGAKKWDFTTSYMTGAAPALGADGTVYLGSFDGRMYAVSAGEGVALSAWPTFMRNPRHTGAGLVRRLLNARAQPNPAQGLAWNVSDVGQTNGGYSAGLSLRVSLVAQPPIHAGYFTLEDQPPAGWQVSQISGDGYFDPTSKRLRWGPYWDAQPRQLSYTVTPLAGQSGLKQFNGSYSTDGVEGVTDGDATLSTVPLHPADNDPVDRRVSLKEMLAYGLAWKQGTAWPLGPNPIPPLYLDSAADLWRQGEVYCYDTNYHVAPLWWVNPARLLGPDSLDLAVAQTGTTSLTALRQLPEGFTPGAVLRVTIRVTVSDTITAYALEELPPAGWTISAVNEGGVWDGLSGKVKWGPFFDAAPRELTYEITAPAGWSVAATFAGVAQADTVVAKVGGAHMTLPGYAPARPFAERQLPTSVSAGLPVAVTLLIAPPSLASLYYVEEFLPEGWTFVSATEGGTFNAASRKIEFGPYFDAAARSLDYTVLPPANGQVELPFYGLARADISEALIQGRDTVAWVPIHPADRAPGDFFLTLFEAVAYSAAWKQGRPWPAAPSPITFDHVTNAVTLWQQGEAYHYVPELTNAPDCWRNLSTVPPGGYPTYATNLVAGSNAWSELPLLYEAGKPFLVTLHVNPPTHTSVYALEDAPPADWLPLAISPPGRWDALSRKVKWGPIFEAAPQSFAYQVVPSNHSTGSVFFVGAIASDGVNALLGGRRVATDMRNGPVFTLIAPQDDGSLLLELRLLPGWPHGLEASTDLGEWLILTNFISPTPVFQYRDPPRTNLTQRFYRAWLE